MKAFVRSVCELIESGETVALATVIESSGSTPRSSGAKMVVRRDGSIVGTVGGGLGEAMACRKGIELMARGNGAAETMYVDMTQELAADSDMICGGGLLILLEIVAPGGSCARAYAETNTMLRTGMRSSLSTRLEGTQALKAVSHVVLTDISIQDTPTVERDENGLTLQEPFIPAAPLYIFGAGHVSLFTAQVGAMIGFRTVVLDDRDDFANLERFPQADEVVVLPSFTGCCERLGIGDDAFIVIVTRGHLHDRTVLEEALKTNARYIGMIGSKKKRDKIYEVLLAEGVTQANIDRCHCPIGLTIGAQTPEEIGVSIGAELIQVRAGLR